MFTIKELTQAVGCDITPRMVRHYHDIGLLPQPARSPSNYRLYSDSDVQFLQQIVALKQQGFQLSHIQQLLSPPTKATPINEQLQRQYQSVLSQIIKLRHTATALEGMIGRDRACQSTPADALAHLQTQTAPTQTAPTQTTVQTQTVQALTDALWQHLDASTAHHPEDFQESLQQLLPDLSQRPEIEADVISHLVLACGDVSLSAFMRFSPHAVTAAREHLTRGCKIIGDIPAVVALFDQARLTHLRCESVAFLNDPHIDNATAAEQAFWQNDTWLNRLDDLIDNNIWVIGYSPSVLMKLCERVEKGARPALIIGLPLGFSHAPATKRRLVQLSGSSSNGTPHITSEGSFGGGLLAAVALNRLAASLIERPDCHCHLGR